MAKLNLKIPILVQNVNIEEKSQYYLRPLFLNHPGATNRRFELAISNLKKEVKQIFKGYELNREQAENLFWFCFNPNPKYKVYEFQYTIGSQFISGTFGVATFTLKGLTFACLPLLNDYMVMLDQSANNRDQQREQIEALIERILRKFKKEQDGDFLPDIYFSDKKEFLTTIEVDININEGPFKIEREQNNWFFSRMAPISEFHGGIEIEKVGYSLNSLYPAELLRSFHRDEIVKKFERILLQKENTPIVLIGREGVGKHSVIHEAVFRQMQAYSEEEEDQPFQIWHIDPTRIISGMSIVGMWQKRFEAILAYIMNLDDEVDYKSQLVIDNPIALLRIGKSAQNNMTLSDVLKPYLEKRHLQLTLIATPDEWKIVQEKDRRFSDLFQVIRLNEPDLKLAVQMVLEQRKVLEVEYDCTITIQAIQQMFDIYRNYLRTKALPGSVVKLMKQLAVKYRAQMVDAPEVRDEFKIFSGLKQRIFDDGLTLDKEEVNSILAQEVVGQPEAVNALADVIHMIKARLSSINQPRGTFLFIGPTGVGKTQAAKVLSNFLMGNEEHLLRFDMNEYIDEFAIHRLIGDEVNPEGQLTGKVRYHPFSIILLDEIEKAHPLIRDLLLQVLDDGRLTDSLGRTVDFSNTIIIMTSNIGASTASSYSGFGKRNDDVNHIYRKEVENFFRPEFINRIDKIVVFEALELEHILKIARLQIKELLQRDGFVRRTTILDISQDALDWVARRGYDERMGGRALKRQIESDLTTLSAEQLIKTSTENPIIFTIGLKKDQLVPEVTTLDFIETLNKEWMPKLPEPAKGKGFYGRLLKAVNRLENQIKFFEEKVGISYRDTAVNTGNWQYYHFRDKVAQTKEHIEHNMLAFNDGFSPNAPAIPLRLKRGQLMPKGNNTSTKGARENFKDQLFQKEGLKELREAYQFANYQFDSINSQFLDNFLNVAFLSLFTQGFIEGEPDQLTFAFQSCITGMGNWEIDFLMDKYAKFFEELDISYKLKKKQRKIEAEGYGLGNLLAGEEGIHLFYTTQQTPLPIRLKISQKESKKRQTKDFKVVRIFDKATTLTDLRSGFSNVANYSVNEFKFFLYAGITDQLRQKIAPMR